MYYHRSVSNNVWQGECEFGITGKWKLLELVVYGTMVKILVILKSPCIKGCHLIYKREPVFGRVCLQLWP